MPQEWQKSRTIPEAFRHAWDGLRSAWAAERNIRIQIVVYPIALVAGVLAGLPALSLALIVLMGSFVVCLELINTALEDLSNVVSPSFHPVLRGVKDMAAGAVLVASAGAVLVGLLLFVPALL